MQQKPLPHDCNHSVRDERRLIALPEVLGIIGCKKSTLYRLLQRDPTFPRMVKIGRATRLHEGALRRWVDEQANLAEAA
jgi:predicted DNA-binding transcriptional regulator AlpA